MCLISQKKGWTCFSLYLDHVWHKASYLLIVFLLLFDNWREICFHNIKMPCIFNHTSYGYNFLLKICLTEPLSSSPLGTILSKPLWNCHPIIALHWTPDFTVSGFRMFLLSFLFFFFPSEYPWVIFSDGRRCLSFACTGNVCFSFIPEW